MSGRDSIAAFLEWVQAAGLWGAIIFGLAYIPSSLLFVPASVLTLGAGFVFGVAKGTVIVSLGSTAGATAAFLVARYIGHEWVARKMARHPSLDAIYRAVKTEALKVVLLTRLSPLLPFNALNYAFGLSPVPLGTYVFGSWIGMLPGTLMYVYIGSAAHGLAALAAGNIRQTPGQRYLFVTGLVATIALTAVVTRAARRTLGRIVSPSQSSSQHWE